MKKITIEVSDERYQNIQDRFAIDFGWEWNDNKDFAKQFSQWVVMQALDLDLDDAEEEVHEKEDVSENKLTYTLEELLNEHTRKQDFQKIDWSGDEDDISFALSPLLGGSYWVFDRQNKTISQQFNWKY
jgi:hypothetical protein